MKLSPKDLMQAPLAEGTMVEIVAVEDQQFLVIKSEYLVRSFRINDNFDDGNFWLDAFAKNALVELYFKGEFAYMLSINLKDEFDVLFPNAQDRWGSYFFKLHYST